MRQLGDRFLLITRTAHLARISGRKVLRRLILAGDVGYDLGRKIAACADKVRITIRPRSLAAASAAT